MIGEARDQGDGIFERPRHPWYAHLGAVALVSLIVAIRFGSLIVPGGVKADEGVYVEAFRAVSAGVSPYEEANALNLRY